MSEGICIRVYCQRPGWPRERWSFENRVFDENEADAAARKVAMCAGKTFLYN